MNIYKSITLKWWQVSLFKLSMISLGIAIGATWNDAVMPAIALFWLLFLAAGTYLMNVWYKQ